MRFLWRVAIIAVAAHGLLGQTSALRPDEIKAPADDDAAIKSLLHDALEIQSKPSPSVADLDKEMDYFQQILDIKSDHAVAWDGLTKARAQKQALLDKQSEEGQKKSAGAAAAGKSEEAFAGGDIETAQAEMEKARTADPNNPRVVRMAQRIKDEFIRRQRQRLVAFTTGGVVLLALVLGGWRWIRTPRTPVLELLDGAGARFVLDKEVTRVGSIAGEGDRRNDIVLNDPDGMLSRYHCEIRNRRSRLFLVDCNSRNGTAVDGRKIPPQRLVPLRDGAGITLALTHELRIVFERKK